MKKWSALGWGTALMLLPVMPAFAGAKDKAGAVMRDCAECHRQEALGRAMVAEWEASRHAANGIGCYDCHQAKKGEPDAFEHHGRMISTIVSPADCAGCHETEAKQFMHSHHARGGEILGSLDNVLGEVVEGVPAVVNGCRQCHGGQVKVMANGRLDPTTWPNTGIGRLNPDGSKGSCSACHSRHLFSAKVARRPENCGKCHLGPDHPQIEIYQESKHGIAFAANVDRMNLEADSWVLGRDYTAAPTCATCHLSATPELAATHDPGERISWTLRPVISKKQDRWEQKRGQMKQVCVNCHSTGYVENFYAQYDNAVELYNQKFALPAQAVMDRLKAEGKLTPNPFDQKIEWTFYYLWHHEGRRARMGASMMGPDYTQWHGFFEVAERFYLEFLPEAEELLPGVSQPVLAADDHQWLKGIDAAERKRIQEFYEKRYGQTPRSAKP